MLPEPHDPASDYSAAIDILTTGFDGRAIAILLAKEQPGVFIRLAAMTNTPKKNIPERFEEICALLQAGKKVDAIKMYREATGKGLKDSKDACDAIEAKLKSSKSKSLAELFKEAEESKIEFLRPESRDVPKTPSYEPRESF